MKALIVQTAYIGDVVLATPLIEAVSRRYPGIEISFLTIHYSAPILKNHPRLKEVIILEKRGTESNKSFLRIMKKLKREEFDLAITPHRSLRSALLVRLAGIPRRIGFDRSAGKWMFNDVVKYRKDYHEVKRNLSLIGMESAVITPAIFPGVDAQVAAGKILDAWRIRGTFIAIAPGSIWPTKRWPVEHYRESIGKLRAKGFPPVILVGARGERELCEMAGSGHSGYAFVSAGRLDPLESAALLKKAAVLIANDSAAGHIAAAVGTKVITIFGATAPSFGFAPYGGGHRIAELADLYCHPCKVHGSKKCPEGHFRCMRDLKPEMVIEMVEEIII